MTSTIRIGGTRAASILGVGFQTPLRVWSEMTGKVVPDDISGLEHIEAGNFLEDGAARWWAHRTGLKVLDCPGMLVDHEFPWLSGTPDRAVINADGTPGLLSCKATGVHARLQWDDDDTIPLGYQIQESVYLRITGYEIAHYAAIIGGQKLRTPQMRRDDAFIKAMIAELERFIAEHVQKDIAPEATVRDNAWLLSVSKALWPNDSGRVIHCTTDSPGDKAVESIIAAKARLKAEQDIIDTNRVVVEGLMQDATHLLTSHGKVTWKTQTAEYKAQAARTVTTRVFRTT